MSEDNDILQSVERTGWHTVGVEWSEDSPSFLYTIGLGTSWDHPEVIVFGLPNEVAYSIVATVVDRVREGMSCATPGIHHDLLGDLPVWVRPVHPSQVERYLGYAMGYYRLVGRPSDLRAVQLFWPDKVGRLPNDTQCEPEVAAAQPRLEIPAVDS